MNIFDYFSRDQFFDWFAKAWSLKYIFFVGRFNNKPLIEKALYKLANYFLQLLKILDTFVKKILFTFLKNDFFTLVENDFLHLQNYCLHLCKMIFLTLVEKGFLHL